MNIVAATGKWLGDLFSSWFDSLKIFLPKNLKLFLLVILKSLITSWKVFFYCALLTSVVIYLFLRFVLPEFDLSPDQNFYLIRYLDSFMRVFFIAVAALCVRPSVEKKTFWYFVRYLNCALGFAIIASLLILALTFLYATYATVTTVNGVSVGLWPVVPLSSLTIAAFFWFDTDGSLQSAALTVMRTVKMLMYNLPFFCIGMFLGKVIWGNVPFLIYQFIGGNAFGIINYIYRWLFTYLLSRLSCTFYTKRLHDNYKRYY